MTARNGFFGICLDVVRNDFASGEQRGLPGLFKARQLNAYVIFCNLIADAEVDVEPRHRSTNVPTLERSKLFKSQLGNLSRIPNARLPDLDDFLGDDQGQWVSAVGEAKFAQGLLIRSDQTLNVFRA